MKQSIALIIVIVVALGGLIAWSLWPTPPTGPKFIGSVSLTEVDIQTMNGFKAGLQELGHVEGRDFVLAAAEPAREIGRLEPLIAGHLRNRVDLLLISSTPATLAAKRLTESNPVPMVFAPVNDPVGAGIVPEMKHPGGNITGVRLPVGDQPRLQWLLRLQPKIRRVLVPYTPEDKSALASLEEMRKAADVLGIVAVAVAVHAREDIRALVRDLPPEIDAIYLPRDSSVESQIDLFVRTSLEHKLPLSAPSTQQVERGALVCYGFMHYQLGRQAARLADQILFQGADPGDLPVEIGRNYLSLNLKTAEAIGLEVPEAYIRQAEKVVR